VVLAIVTEGKNIPLEFRRQRMSAGKKCYLTSASHVGETGIVIEVVIAITTATVVIGFVTIV